MALKIIHHSKHVVKRVIIGLVTGITGFLTIYYLGFNKAPSRPSEAVIKDNTIKTWKNYIALENDMATRRDSNYRRFMRKALDMTAYVNADSVICFDFLGKLEKLKEAKEVDKLLYLLFNARLRYRKDSWSDFKYLNIHYKAIQDSLPGDSTTRNFLLQELNTSFTNKNTNFSERLGHMVEDIAIALNKRFKYPFSISDLTYFNPFYQNLKKIRSQEPVNFIRNEVTPGEPGSER